MMISLIYDNQTFEAFRGSSPDPSLLALVERLVTRTKGQGFWTSTRIVVGEPSADLLGFDPVAEAPDWAWRRQHIGSVFMEFGLILDDFTWIVLVPAGGKLALQGS